MAKATVLDLHHSSVRTVTPGMYVGNLDISGHASQTWQIIRIRVEWEMDGEPYEYWTIVAVDDDGNDLGEDPETINSIMYDYNLL